jgi:penicillin amidase
MQGDVLSLGAQALLPLFKNAQSGHTLQPGIQSVIDRFDGSMSIDSTAALIFNTWVDQLTRILFSRLGDSFTEEYGRRSFRAAVNHQINNPDSPWCDVHTTAERENCQGAANLALQRALNDLSQRYGKSSTDWRWGTAHHAVSEHRPFKNIPLLAKFFNVSIPFPGDAFTVNVGRPVLNNPKAPFQANHAPSLRAIYDLNDPEQSAFMLPTGQSGWVQSHRYRNLSASWATNQLIPLAMKPKQVQRELVLKAKSF